jgi:hypothetical protein
MPGMAAELGIGLETCRTHVKNAMRKLSARTIAPAIASALRRGQNLASAHPDSRFAGCAFSPSLGLNFGLHRQ